MRLVLYESIDCYKVKENIYKTALVRELGEIYKPYLAIHFCSVFKNQNGPRYELTIDPLSENKKVYNINFVDFNKDKEKLIKVIEENLQKNNDVTDCKYHPNNFIVNFSYQDQKKANSLAFTCPKIQYPEQKNIKHPLYQLLYTGGYKKKLENEEDVRKILNQKICRRNFGRDTDLYNLCLRQEDVFQKTINNLKTQSKENFINIQNCQKRTYIYNKTIILVVIGSILLMILFYFIYKN